jgi:hypothetical protein
MRKPSKIGKDVVVDPAAERLPTCSRFSRRAWMSAALLGLAGGRPLTARAGSFSAAERGDRDEDRELERIQTAARTAGLRQFSIGRTEHFLGAGDAPQAYRTAALGVCEQLATVFLGYFRQHGFEVAFPARRMVVVTLKDDRSYGAFLGAEPDDAVGGHYDLDTNRLVVFDFRPRQAELDAKAESVNTFTLVHETAHLLSFNTGLLSRRADVPLCISEGLATFVEIWRPAHGRRAPAIGATNRPRLRALLDAGKDEEPWFEIDKVLDDDKLFEDPAAQQLAYAESWLFAHYLLKTPAQLPKFQAYLKALSAQGERARRLECARAHLGSLSELDRRLKRHARSELR